MAALHRLVACLFARGAFAKVAIVNLSGAVVAIRRGFTLLLAFGRRRRPLAAARHEDTGFAAITGNLSLCIYR